MANRVLQPIVLRLHRIGVVSVATAAVAVGITYVPTTATADPSPSPSPSASATADPTNIPALEKALGTLALQSSQLVEQYNQARLDVQAKTKAAASAELEAQAAAADFSSARQQLATTVVALYQGGSTFSATGALLNSSSGDGYLQQLQSLAMVSNQTALVVKNLSDAKTKADTARAKAQQLLADAKSKQKSLSDQRTATQDKIDKYKQLLSELNAQQRRAYLRAQAQAVSDQAVRQQQNRFNQIASAPQGAAAPQSSTSAPSTPAPSGSVNPVAAAAIQFALAQVGKPYVWGAAGPDTYDCSGLTMQAYAHAGISLPHSAREQYSYGTHVSVDALQPGDLVFFYSPIAHVALYIGDGMVVHAPTSGQDVTVRPLASMNDLVGATRLVG